MELQKIYTDETKNVTAFAESRIGGRRENQDSFDWANTDLGYLVTVCDGMGGGPGGKTASSIAVREIIAGVTEANKEEETPNIIIKAIRRANMAIIEAGNNNPQLKGMGSTATVLLINENSAVVAHVGDSRVYQVRSGSKVFRTFDHSMVFEMVAEGVITEEQARLSAQSNVITRALGIKPDVEVDVAEVPFEKGDRFVLCSDGIHGTMPEKELLKMFSDRKRVGVLVDDVATYIDNLGHNTGGGHDNLTLAIVETNINSKLKSKMSKQTKFIILGLTVLLVLCFIMNIVQCSGSSTSGESILKNNITRLEKELSLKSDTIDSLDKTVSEIKVILDNKGVSIKDIDSIFNSKSK